MTSNSATPVSRDIRRQPLSSPYFFMIHLRWSASVASLGGIGFPDLSGAPFQYLLLHSGQLVGFRPLPRGAHS